MQKTWQVDISCSYCVQVTVKEIRVYCHWTNLVCTVANIEIFAYNFWPKYLSYTCIQRRHVDLFLNFVERKRGSGRDVLFFVC